MSDDELGGVLAVWTDVDPAHEADFNEWYDREHLAERCFIPGFRSARRYAAVSGKPKYFAWYQTETVDALTGAAYRERLGHPTSWSERIMPQFRNTQRSVNRVRLRFGEGPGALFATLRFALRRGADPEALLHWAGAHLVALERHPGVVLGELWQGFDDGRAPPGGAPAWTLCLSATGLPALRVAVRDEHLRQGLAGAGAVRLSPATYRFLNEVVR